MNNFKSYYGFLKEPFRQEISINDIYAIPGLKGLSERFMYAVNGAMVNVVTGDVGTGKSTSLRFVSSKLHPSAYKVIQVVANTGTMLELLRQIALSLGSECRSPSITTVTKTVRGIILEIAERKQTPVLIIDEAHLLRFEVLAQLHTLLQYEFDSRELMPLVMCGHSTLIDKLYYHTSRPLASRVSGKTHLEGLRLKEMEGYLMHHLTIAGVKDQLFSEEAVLAIQQNSAGLLRKANMLAKGSLMAAAQEQCNVISAEHVRIASTEVF